MAGEVTVTTVLPVEPEQAFSLFTTKIDRWWVRPVDTVIRFEGDQLIAADHNGVRSIARVISWEPPGSLLLEWAGPYGRPGDQVAIEFQPEGTGTRVTVRHQRAGLAPSEASAAVLGLFWAEVLRRTLQQAR
ncbi:MAG TPA: SRPBCC domain-containing protein [Acidimicrobiia bacterium]|nr:SRPBCC domain-containing protein [Acidimicrobiia bacterium]